MSSSTIHDFVRPHFSLGAAIYIAIKPLVKIYLSLGLGFFMVKVGILTPAGQKSIGQMVLNVFTPCLIFYNIVKEIKDTDIKLLGVIVLTSFMFYMSGLMYGFVLRMVSPIPRGWFGGLLLASMVNNVSDLPVAYVLTLGKAKQIPSSQATKGTAYVVLFTIMFTIMTFNAGGTRLVAWDFDRHDPHRQEATVPPFSPEKVIKLIKGWSQSKMGANASQDSSKSTMSKAPLSVDSNDELEEKERHASGTDEAVTSGSALPSHTEDLEPTLDAEIRRLSTQFSNAPSSLPPGRDHPHMHYYGLHKHHNDLPNGETESFYCSSVSSSDAEDDDDGDQPNNDVESATGSRHAPSLHESVRASVKSHKKSFKRRWRRFREYNKVTEVIAHFIEDLRMPQMMALIISITIAMIPWVKRVFTNDPQQPIKGFHDPPDGNPPLDFLMDFISFMSGAQVPLGLMMLGGTMARLKIGKLVPGFWRTAVLLAMFKLVILPIISCAWIARLQSIGWIDRQDVLVPVVMGVASGTPTATMQIYLTLAHTPADAEPMELNCLAVCLIVQYIILPIPMTILVTYVLKTFVE